MSVCVVVGEFWYFLIGRQPITGPFWWNAGVFSSHLLQIVSTLRMVKLFFSMGETRVPFLDQRILVPSAFSVARRCCTGIGIGCYGVGGRLAARLLGRWTTGPVYDERTSFLPVHEYCTFLRHWLSVCKPVLAGWLFSLSRLLIFTELAHSFAHNYISFLIMFMFLQGLQGGRTFASKIAHLKDLVLRKLAADLPLRTIEAKAH